MAIYQNLANVMPVASMVTGAAVPSAIGDQIRDNLVALYDGWWFRASRTTSFTTAASATSPIGLDTITMSQSAEDDRSITLVNNSVTLKKPGLWIVGGHYATSTSDTILVLVSATGTPSGFVCESGSDTANAKSDACCSGPLMVAVSSVVSLDYYTVGALSITANSRSPVLWGRWRGDLP